MSTSRMKFDGIRDMENKIADLQATYFHVEVYNITHDAFDYAFM